MCGRMGVWVYRRMGVRVYGRTGKVYGGGARACIPDTWWMIPGRPPSTSCASHLLRLHALPAHPSRTFGGEYPCAQDRLLRQAAKATQVYCATTNSVGRRDSASFPGPRCLHARCEHLSTLLHYSTAATGLAGLRRPSDCSRARVLSAPHSAKRVAASPLARRHAHVRHTKSTRKAHP